MMRLAVNGQQLSRTHALGAALDVLAGFGVDAIELWPANLPMRLENPGAEDNERFEGRDVGGAAALVRARGFQVACVTLGFFAARVCFARGGAAAFTDALCGAVDAATTLGSARVNCYSVGIPLALFGEAMRPAARYAAERGVCITLENEAHDESGLPEAVAHLARAIDSPGFGTQYDPCNYYHAALEPYPAAYDEVAAHIRYVHLKGGARYDPRRAARDKDSTIHKGSPMRDPRDGHIGYVPLPEAAFPIEAIVRHLARDHYDGFVTLEPHVPPDALLEFYEIEIPYLRALLDAANSDPVGSVTTVAS